MTRRPMETMDFETDPFKVGRIPEPFTAGHYDGERFTCFYDDEDSEGQCVEDIADFLEPRKTVCYAHNGGKFDFHYLLHRASDITVFGSRIASMTIGECELRDSFLILPVSLARMDKSEIDYDIFEWPYRYMPENKRRIIEYLKDDCVYLWQWVNEFEQRFGRKQTLAITAMGELRKTGYQPPRVNEATDNQHRPVYSGGRVSVFRNGRIDGSIQYVDINSAYPYAMLYPHPFYEMEVTDEIPKSAFQFPYFALVDCVSNGAIPVREKTGRLGYPVGRVENTWVSGWEIEAGIETDTLDIERVHKVYVSTDAQSMADFVHTWYAEKSEAKQTGDRTRELFAKLILNACYGKFAQNPRAFRDWQIFHATMAPDDPEWQREVTFDGSPFEIWSREKKLDEDAKFFNVLTAASITGFVRAHLWRAICASDDVFYCDTDSLFCRGFHGPIGTEIGEWSVEAEIDTLWIGGRKLYTARTANGEWIKACKGARLTPAQIVEVIESGRGIQWENDAPSFRIGHVSFTKRRIKPT